MLHTAYLYIYGYTDPHIYPMVVGMASSVSTPFGARRECACVATCERESLPHAYSLPNTIQYNKRSREHRRPDTTRAHTRARPSVHSFKLLYAPIFTRPCACMHIFTCNTPEEHRNCNRNCSLVKIAPLARNPKSMRSAPKNRNLNKTTQILTHLPASQRNTLAHWR